MQAAITTESKYSLATWAWLFPATYVVHILEEYFCGEGFYRWVARVVGFEMPPTRFLLMNGVALLLMIVAILIFRHAAAMRWLLTAYATVVVINALMHLAGTLWTRTYSPGVVSGLVLWLPLGIITLLRLQASATRRAFRAGLLTGIGMHVALLLLVFLARELSGV
jgi:hypothetical protein